MLILIGVSAGQTRAPILMLLGPALVVLGETIRFWSVRQIGSISRTRAARHGPLVTTGPFAIIRNPLYAGNALLWTGFVLWSGLLWMLPVAWVLFLLQHKAIVTWEEHHLLGRFGDEYRTYCVMVPRWIPRRSHQSETGSTHSWGHVAFSERGTLLTIAVMAALLTAKHLLG